MKKKAENKEKQKARMLKKQIICNLAAIALLIVLLNFSILVYPKQGMQTRNTTIKFAWFGLASYALADDNTEFTSPVFVERKNPVAELKPGTYYWKAGLGKTRSFVIESEVSVSVTPALLENETTYRVENQGNTRIMLNIIRNIMGITGRVVLEPNAVTYENASGAEKIIASENE